MPVWTPYSIPASVGAQATPPLLGADGKMWCGSAVVVATSVPMYSFNVIDPSTFSVASVPGPSVLNDSGQLSNIIADASNVYGVYFDNFPHLVHAQCDYATHTYSDSLGSSASPFLGLAINGSGIYSTGGNFAGHPEVTGPPGFNSYAYSTGGFGCCILTPTTLWSPVLGAAYLLEVNASTLALNAAHSMPASFNAATPGGSGQQIGYDGRYIYMASGSSGVIVFDTVASTYSVFGSFVAQHCYYSANFNLVFVSDASANTYTMPVGGGTLTNIGNISSMTSGGVVAGFGDGPNGAIWATASVPSANSNWFLSMPKQVSPLVMAPS